MDARFESTDVVRLRRNRLILALPALVLIVGLVAVLLRRRNPEDEEVLAAVPRTLLAPRPPPSALPQLGPAVQQVQGVGQLVFDAWQSAPQPKQVKERRSSLAHGELVAAFSLTLAIAIWQLNPFPRRRRGTLVADAEGITWQGERFVAREDLAQGVMRAGWGAATVVRLERHGTVLAHELEVSDPREGRRLLWALGLDAAQVAATFWVDSLARTHRVLKYGLWALRLAVLVLAGFVAIELGRHGLVRQRAVFGLALLVFLVALYLLRRWPVMVRVGTDGVLQRWLWMRRFVPYDRVERLERFEWGVRLHASKDPPLELTVFRVSFFVPKSLVQRFKRIPRWLEVRRDLLAQRIEDAMGAREGRVSLVGDDGSELPRAISIPEWMKRLRAQDDDEPPLSRDALQSILDDPWADPATRVAAAMTLAPPKNVLLALADACARPELAEAFRAMAREDERRLERVLGRLRR